jgi:ketosteroid isomerase-like protein
MRHDYSTTLVAATLTTILGLSGVAAAGEAPTADDLAADLFATEESFAETMADRDHQAFASFLADETVFFGGRGEIRGKAAVAAAWKPFFDGPSAPFSWQPDTAAVLDSGTLGLTSGPVFAPDGTRIGTFNSVWRREPGGSWKIVFDRGCPDCDCPPSSDPPN